MSHACFIQKRLYYNNDKKLTNPFCCFLFSEVHDYCAYEDFEASCGPDEVIMTTSAKYGRMALGRCVKRNYGYLGCALDALAYVDAKCSGRRQCSFSVYEDSLRELQPCPEDISAYLEASYTCQKGEIMPETSMILLHQCETVRPRYCTHSLCNQDSQSQSPKNCFSKCCPKNYGVEEGNLFLS